jgi:hypothetical protein
MTYLSSTRYDVSIEYEPHAVRGASSMYGVGGAACVKYLCSSVKFLCSTSRVKIRRCWQVLESLLQASRFYLNCGRYWKGFTELQVVVSSVSLTELQVVLSPSCNSRSVASQDVSHPILPHASLLVRTGRPACLRELGQLFFVGTHTHTHTHTHTQFYFLILVFFYE